MFNVIGIRTVVHQPFCQNRHIDQSTLHRSRNASRQLRKLTMPKCRPTKDRYNKLFVNYQRLFQLKRSTTDAEKNILVRRVRSWKAHEKSGRLWPRQRLMNCRLWPELSHLSSKTVSRFVVFGGFFFCNYKFDLSLVVCSLLIIAFRWQHVPKEKRGNKRLCNHQEMKKITFFHGIARLSV